MVVGDILTFLDTYKTPLFYGIIILLIIIYRKKFEFQGRIIAIRRTGFGIEWMKRFAAKNKELLKILGYCGIGVGFLLMVFMFGFVFYALWQFFQVPDAPPAFSPLLPGVNIPGIDFMIPLWVILPLFVVVLLHEMGHGVVAKAHGIPITSTGFVLFGPLPGAFVEPDEKKIAKANDVVKYSIFSAGPFANMLTLLVTIVLLFAVFNPAMGAMQEPVGFSVSGVAEGFPAAAAGVSTQAIYNEVNGETVMSPEELLAIMIVTQPGDSLSLTDTDGNTIELIADEHPDYAGRGYLGVTGIAPEVATKSSVPQWLFVIVQFLRDFVAWVGILSFGLGAVNLLPLGPVDGGRMIQLAFTSVYGKKKGSVYWVKLGIFLFIIVLFLIIAPILKALI